MGLSRASIIECVRRELDERDLWLVDSLTVPAALWADALTVWQIYVVAFIEGSLFVFFNSP